MAKKKIILIGASGILGKFFFKNLSNDKDTALICCADNNLKTDLKSKNKKFKLDISNEIEIKKFFKYIRSSYGEFDCLITNAAYTTEAALKENSFKNPQNIRTFKYLLIF